MDNALAQKQIEEKVFGVSFALGNPEFHFGGVNPELYTDPIEFHEVIRPSDSGKDFSYWLLGNARVYVGDSEKLANLQTIICTNTLSTWGPRTQVAKIYESIPGSEEAVLGNLKGLYKFPCAKAPKVELSWGKNEAPYRWEYLG